MSVMNANNTHAMCKVTGASNGTLTFTNAVGFNTAGQSAHASTGVYVLQLDECITDAEATVVLGATAGTDPTFLYTITQSSTPVTFPGTGSTTYLPTLLTVTTLDSGSAANTVSFSCTVLRSPQFQPNT